MKRERDSSYNKSQKTTKILKRIPSHHSSKTKNELKDQNIRVKSQKEKEKDCCMTRNEEENRENEQPNLDQRVTTSHLPSEDVNDSANP